MPAPRMMKSRDIADYLGVSIQTARNMMTAFQMRGLVIETDRKWTAAEKRHGQSPKRSGSPVKLVDAKVFARYLSDMDGQDYDERLHDVQSFLAEKRRSEVS